jgi:hypothetical protein
MNRTEFLLDSVRHSVDRDRFQNPVIGCVSDGLRLLLSLKEGQEGLPICFIVIVGMADC